VRLLVTVELRQGESPEHLLKRFRKEVSKSGIMKAVRKKRWFMSKSEQRRKARAKAIRKAQRKEARRKARRRRW
jgi:small subunit ribosomal protein S21